MNIFLNRLLFIGFIPIMMLIICLATILVLPYWLVTGTEPKNTQKLLESAVKDVEKATDDLADGELL